MKVLMLMPPFLMKERYGKGFEKIGSVLPPLGLLYLGAVLEKAGHKPEILDTQFYEWAPKKTAEECAKYDADVIGIYCNTSNYAHAVRLADELKELNDVPIVFGGPHVTTRPMEVLKNKSVDYVVFGEGEYSFLELVNHLSKRKGASISRIKGIGYKDSSGRPRLNAPRSLIKNLDELPFPARHLVDMGRYRPSPNQYKRLPTATMIASRGCPYNCKFCDVERLWGRAYRARSVENVIQEIKALVRDYGIRDINFWDDLWGLNKEWVHGFCKAVEREKLDITWCCECRVNTINPETLRMMKKAGCWAIFFGVESLDQGILDAVSKHTSVKMIEDALRWTKAAGIEIRANFILALPEETPGKVKCMLDKLCRLNPDYVKFNILTPYPDTVLYDEIKAGKWGRLVSEDYDKLTGYFATFVPHGYRDAAQVEAVRRYAYRRYYFRAGYIFSRLRSVRNTEDIRRLVRGVVAIANL